MTEANKKKIDEFQNLIDQLSDQHFEVEMGLENLQDDSEAGITNLEREMEGIEEDMAIYVAEIKKLKAMK